MGHLGYLFGVMWICLAMAALLGFLLAFFWRQSTYARQRSEFERKWLLRVRQTEQDRDARIAKLTSEIEEHRLQIPTLEKSLAERSHLIAELESDVTRWKEQVAPLEKKISLLSDGQNQPDVQDVKEWESKVKSAERERETAQKELAKLQTEFEQLRERHNSANAEANQARQELEAQLAQSESIVAQLGAAADEVAEMREAMKLVNSEADLAEKLTLDLTTLKAEHDDLASRYEEVLGDLEAQTDIHEADRAELEQMRVAVDQAQSELSELRQLHEASLRKTNERSSDSENLKAKNEKLQAALDEIDEKNSSTHRQLKNELSELKAERAKTGDAHVAEIKRLTVKLDELHSASKESATQVNNQKMTIKQLEEQLFESKHSGEEAKARIDALTAKARVHDRQTTEIEALTNQVHALESQSKEIEILNQQLRTLEHQSSDVDELSARAASAAKSAEDKQAKLDELRLSLEHSEQARRAIEHKMTEDHRRELHRLKTKQQEFKSKQDVILENFEVERRSMHNKYSALESRYSELEKSNETMRSTHEDAVQKLQAKLNDALKTRSSNKNAGEKVGKAQIAEAGSKRKKAPKKSSDSNARSIDHEPKWLLMERPDEVDDLKKIWGVGPVMEKTMNGLGIYLFRQVAALKKQDIEWIASHINTFPDRIERDDWVGQAADLRREKYGR